MKKRLILLVDLSKHSIDLVKYAAGWSQEMDAEILIIHQTLVLAPALTDGGAKQQIAEHVNAEATKKLRAIASDHIPPKINVSFLVSENNLKQLLDYALKQPFEHLVYVGVQQTDLLKKIFIGSTALQIINNTSNAVVAIPKGIDSFSHKQIFVAVTKNARFNVLELNNFLKFIDSTDTNITFFHLAKSNEETTGIEKKLKDLTELFADRYQTDYAIYQGKQPFEDIKKVINNKIDELLVVQKGSRLWTDQFFRRFLINTLIYEGQTPLVVLPQ